MGRARLLRLVGAVLVLLGGTIHLKLNLDDYGNDDILKAFALNAAASALVAAYLVLRDDVVGPIAGLAVSIGSLGAFAMSRRGDGILDFREVGWNPSPEAPSASASRRPARPARFRPRATSRTRLAP